MAITEANIQVDEMQALQERINATVNDPNVVNGQVKSFVGVAKELGVNDTLLNNPRFVELFSKRVNEMVKQKEGINPISHLQQFGSFAVLPDSIFQLKDAEFVKNAVEEQSHFFSTEEALNFDKENKEKGNQTGGFSYVAMKIDDQGNVAYYEANTENSHVKDFQPSDVVRTRLTTYTPTEEGGFKITESGIRKDNLTGKVEAIKDSVIKEYTGFGVDVDAYNKYKTM